MKHLEIAKEVVTDHLADGIDFMDVYEHWSADDVEDEETLRKAHDEANRILLTLVGKVAVV